MVIFILFFIFTIVVRYCLSISRMNDWMNEWMNEWIHSKQPILFLRTSVLVFLRTNHNIQANYVKCIKKDWCWAQAGFHPAHTDWFSSHDWKYRTRQRGRSRVTTKGVWRTRSWVLHRTYVIPHLWRCSLSDYYTNGQIGIVASSR
jgi:hypothetical protein